MRVLGLNPGHDGAVALLTDSTLMWSFEAEKDSGPRFGGLSAALIWQAFQQVPEPPDVIAIGGWHRHLPGTYSSFAAGYEGLEAAPLRSGNFMGRSVQLYSSSHERSHIFMATAMHADAPLERCVVLVWEGTFGAFYLWSRYGAVIERVHVLSEPGAKYAAVFAVADPLFALDGNYPRAEDAGKLMALAAYGDAADCPTEDRDTVDRILRRASIYPLDKGSYHETGLYNCGVDTPRFRAAAKYLTDRIFEIFSEAARRLPGCTDLPLLVAGGCGLNCDWNERWRREGPFTSVFVPPCANDSGSAIGTAVDAMVQSGRQCRIDWSVFSGCEFEEDEAPDPARWRRCPFDPVWLSERLRDGEVVAWVQERYEIGPRALGHRSLLASPLRSELRERLNAMKGRERYRPVAPCCRREDVRSWFDTAEPDPFMLFLASVTTPLLPAVTHVDGTARLQAVSESDNRRLHRLLGAFGDLTGVGVLCNTSLNFHGRGFVNRTSDLMRYAAAAMLRIVVVNDDVYVHRSIDVGGVP